MECCLLGTKLPTSDAHPSKADIARAAHSVWNAREPKCQPFARACHALP
jgi:hypothetical protein